MKISTVKKYINLLEDIKSSGKSIQAYCKEHGIRYHTVTWMLYNLNRSKEELSKECQSLLSLYKELTDKFNRTNPKTLESQKLDNDERSKVELLRDSEGKIQYYSYEIFRKDKCPLCGKLTREEMNTIYRLYSYYGDSLTQRVISRHFVDLSLVDFKRILRAFQITKASAPFAPHYFEEYSEDELREIQLREKENSFLRKAEEDVIKNNEKLLKKYAQENIELKKSLNAISNINITVTNKPAYKTQPSEFIESDKDLILHLSDMHIGAKVESGALYPNEWNERELMRRLSSTLDKIQSFGHFNTIVINLLGDNLDGMDNQTARRDHFIPQNMDNMEQVNTFVNVMCWFISSIKLNNICNNIKLYSVREGNHDGCLGYAASVAALSCIKSIYPEVETTQFTEFFGYYEFKSHKWLICHGKDAKFMRKGMPLNLDDRNKIRLYEYLDSRNITGTGIHIIKGDLHTENINSCLKLDYRNVLSLFGASDYSNMNFPRNQFGISYELFIGDNLVRGTFENI